MRKIQIGTILFEDEKTTEIYNQYKNYFRVEVEYEWLKKYVIFVLLFSLTDNEQLATKACTVLRRAHADSKEEVVKLDSAKLRKMRGCGAKMEELIMKAIEVIRKEGAYVTTAKEFSPKKEIKKLRFKVVENGLCCIDDWHRWVYNVFPDGRVVKYIYVGVSRKYVERDIENVSDSLVMKLFENIDELIIRFLRDVFKEKEIEGDEYDLVDGYVLCDFSGEV